VAKGSEGRIIPAGAFPGAARGAFVFAIAVALAYLEVQIEGPDGWAGKLPTWRSNDPALTWIFGGRPVTGYHVGLNVLLLLLLHWPFAFKKWSLVDEARVLQAFACLGVVWDFLWFVLNPAYGLHRYDAAHVWWFKHWLLGVPVDYFVGIALALSFGLVPALANRERLLDGVCEALAAVFVPVSLATLCAVVL
jgi:hypothetical protein